MKQQRKRTRKVMNITRTQKSKKKSKIKKWEEKMKGGGQEKIRAFAEWPTKLQNLNNLGVIKFVLLYSSGSFPLSV